jgi:hypothetical protein
MNIRIKELAEQAGYNLKDDGTLYAFDDFDLEKFSLSIVKECADRIRKEVEFGNAQLTNSGAYKLAFMNQAADIIEDHFKEPTVDMQLRNRSTYFGSNP